MRINLRELRYALRCTKRSGPQPDVILRCRRFQNTTTRPSRSKTRSAPSEATFLSEPEDDAGGALYRRARLDRTKLEQIAERWEETSADLMMTEASSGSRRRRRKPTGDRPRTRSAGPPLYRQLTYTDTPPVTSTTRKPWATCSTDSRDVPAQRDHLHQGARDTPDEIWIEAFDDQRLVAGQAPGTPQADPITLTKTASRRMARMLNDPNRYTPGERVVIRRRRPDEGPETVEMILDRPRPGSGTEDSDRITSARIQWTSRTATAPELMQSAYARLRDASSRATESRYNPAGSSPRSQPLSDSPRSSSHRGTNRRSTPSDPPVKRPPNAQPWNSR